MWWMDVRVYAGKETKPTGTGVVIVVPRPNWLDFVGPATGLSFVPSLIPRFQKWAEEVQSNIVHNLKFLTSC